MENNPLEQSVQYLKGVGPARLKLLQKIGVNSLEDLLYYFPRRYQDRRNFIPIAALEQGQVQAIRAKIISCYQRSSFYRRGFKITEIVAADKSGKITCVWFNQPYIKNYLKIGEEAIFYGRVGSFGKKLQMHSPEFEVLSVGEDAQANSDSLMPVYSLPDSITQRYFRDLIKLVIDAYLPKLHDFIPYSMRQRNNLLNLAKALVSIHFPADQEARALAYQRLAFDEFLFFQIPLALRKHRRKEEQGIAHKTEGGLVDCFLRGLGFKLTSSQEQVLKEIKKDMASPQVMQRLLQGDVGSGKTVVATASCLMAVQGGFQAAFMVPTEILARQHYEKISSQLSAISRQPSAISRQPSAISFQLKAIKVALLTSALNKKEKEKIYQGIKNGAINLVIGTHALLQQQVEFKNLGLVVIDEQHKFGVGQRALLPQKGKSPDILIMTATPIPRTLAITIYGDLDVSVISELPAGKGKIKTMNFSVGQEKAAYSLAKKELEAGRQAYIIYPVIEESYALDMEGAKKKYAQLSSGDFKQYRLGLIHGRLDDKQQNQLMQDFRDKKLDILVSTTILEVGIDIPNATCIIIENAERFGLSQLHQLRGRVGRGKDDAYCLLIANTSTVEAKARMEAMVNYSDGFHISEEDLRIRGPGEFFGMRQHGLSQLKIANPLTQMQLLKKARDEALRLINDDAGLVAKDNVLIRQRLFKAFPEYENLILTG
ncbi:MAG: ATP-dependent DNA helicase RecG [Candidatus Omnitrophica bacterium]|jgi:ATP-dependent DNA helicase RecG|nr:ATP-dependent DNA helicase RecG [Candidatus Omnitrophota bacterium]